MPIVSRAILSHEIGFLPLITVKILLIMTGQQRLLRPNIIFLITSFLETFLVGHTVYLFI